MIIIIIIIIIPPEPRLEKVNVKTEKANKLLTDHPTGNTTDLNKLIYAKAKFVSDKIDIPQRKPNRNTKLGWEICLKGQIKRIRQISETSKEGKTQRKFC